MLREKEKVKKKRRGKLRALFVRTFCGRIVLGLALLHIPLGNAIILILSNELAYFGLFQP